MRIIYNDKLSNFEELLDKDISVSIHHDNVHVLATEMYKVVNGMSPEIMNDNLHYNLGHTSQFFVNPIDSIYNGTESASYLGKNIWEQIPSEIRNEKSLEGFKWEINKWKPTDCPCRICNIFIPNLGFI